MNVTTMNNIDHSAVPTRHLLHLIIHMQLGNDNMAHKNYSSLKPNGKWSDGIWWGASLAAEPSSLLLGTTTTI
jgi:hypothetical protein